MKKETIAEEFNLGTVHSWKKLTGGLVNISYKVETAQGTFVVQQLSDVFTEEVTSRYQAIERYMRTNDLFVPVLLTTNGGKPYIKNESAHYRAFEYIAHDNMSTLNKKSARSAGAILGKFHRVMKDAPYKPETLIENFHNSQYYIEELLKAAESYPQKAEAVQSEIEQCKELEKSRPYDDNLITIHADPKVENMLFKNDEVIAILDLDTMMQGSALIDLGDAFRSWCHKPNNTFDREIYAFALAGYQSEHPTDYSESQIIAATKHITLQLATRFLTDYFHECYFDWDPKRFSSRGEHNLARCQDNLAYLTTIK